MLLSRSNTSVISSGIWRSTVCWKIICTHRHFANRRPDAKLRCDAEENLHRQGCRTGAERITPGPTRQYTPPALAFSWFFRVPPVTAVAVKTVYVAKRDL